MNMLRIMFILLVFSITSKAADLNVYMGPKGADTADGLSLESPVATLQVAIDKLIVAAPGTSGRLQVNVMPGIYLGQKVLTAGASDGRPLTITQMAGSEKRPQFDGDGKGGTWFILRNSSGKPTHISITGLEISNYVTAISFEGSRARSETSNSENIIRNLVLRNIGQIAFPAGQASTAAIRLVNSKNNKILNNHFINVGNITECGALHAIYMAHYSERNEISGNIFNGICGPTIRTRDESNNNIIEKNKFLQQDENPVLSDWYCDKNVRKDCTKENYECPSFDNIFKDNLVVRKNKKVHIHVSDFTGTNTPNGCPLSKSVRLRITEEHTEIQ